MTSSADRSPDKSAKKTGRKQTKALQLVARDYQIGESVGGEPSLNILVCNAGLVTGCSQVQAAVLWNRDRRNRNFLP
jgi:hypothetical protein